ncbi:MAG: VacJ family lipoprotein [Pseudomonadota bacterium]
MNLKNMKSAAALALVALLAACSVPEEPVEIHDPYEKTNRRIHGFNKGLDSAILRPTSRVYGIVLPQPVRQGVSNFANYIDTPRFILNDIAQGNIDDAGHNFARFVLNTVFGFGVLDVASSAGVESRRTGFGETLYVWGAREGAYVELPVLGPSNERDAVGQVVDFISNPISGTIDASQEWVPPTANVMDRVGQRYEFGSTIDSLLYESADSYAQTRNLYLQNRRFELGQADDFAFDPYEDPFFEDPYEE